MLLVSLALVLAPSATLPSAERLWPLAFVTPIGWISFGFREALLGAHCFGILFALPALLLIPVTHGVLRQLRHAYRMDTGLSSPQCTAELYEEHFDDEAIVSPYVRSRIEEIQETQTGIVKHGIIERLVIMFAKSREQKLVAFLALQHENWSRTWRQSVVVGIVGVIVAEITRGQWPFLYWVVPIMACAIGIPFLGGSWRAFLSMNIYNNLCPIHALLPVSYWELSRLIWKINIIRTVSWIPVGITLTALTAYRMACPVDMVKHIVIGALLVMYSMAAAQPFWIGLKFHYEISSGAITGRGFRRLVLALFSFGVLGTAATILILGPLWWQITASLVLLLYPLLTWWICGVWYERGRLDMVYVPAQAPVV
jgi:hypothetical protein